MLTRRAGILETIVEALPDRVGSNPRYSDMEQAYDMGSGGSRWHV